jgi:hypothetical protein
VYIVCFRPIDHCVENELLENFQDINFEDIEQQQTGFEGKCPYACCTYFLYLSIGLHASIFVGIVENHMSHIFSCIILVTWVWVEH